MNTQQQESTEWVVTGYTRDGQPILGRTGDAGRNVRGEAGYWMGSLAVYLVPVADDDE